MTESDDPKGLLREAYRIDEISEAECRSILIDWALSLAADQDARALLPGLVARLGAAAPDHPMTRLLSEGIASTADADQESGRRRRRRRR